MAWLEVAHLLLLDESDKAFEQSLIFLFGVHLLAPFLNSKHALPLIVLLLFALLLLLFCLLRCFCSLALLCFSRRVSLLPRRLLLGLSPVI